MEDNRSLNEWGGISRLVIGLGNAGSEFTGTRHNLGWRALDAFLKLHDVRKDFKPLSKTRVQVVTVGEHIDVLLVRPTTYMNLSGTAVASILNKLEMECEDILVVHDDMDLEEGRAKMRFGGGAAGHKGILNIIEHCGEGFTRIKIGIGAPSDDFDGDGADWVLEKIDPDTERIFDELMPKVAEGILRWVLDGTQRATTWFNTEMRTESGETDEDIEPGDDTDASKEVEDKPDE